MPFERFLKDMEIVGRLDDEPNDVGGLTAGELKEKFDEGGQAVKEYLNGTLLPGLEGTGAAGDIGATPFGKVTGTNVQEQLRQISGSVEQVALGQIPDGSIGADKLADGSIGPEKLVDHSIGPDKLVGALQSYHRQFEAEDWEEGELRIPAAVHRLPTALLILARTLRMRIHRSARDYGESQVAAAKAKFVAAQAAALSANTAAAGTYPVAADGHVMLTWEQVQYYLLEGELVSAQVAQTKATELGFDWKEVATLPVESPASLDQLLAAAYLPALGGSSAALDELWSLACLRGLRFRSGVADKVGEKKKYDLFGRMSGTTWGGTGVPGGVGQGDRGAGPLGTPALRWGAAGHRRPGGGLRWPGWRSWPRATGRRPRPCGCASSWWRSCR